jgi:hypothetical protein
MRSLVLSSFLSLDGCSFDPRSEICRLLELCYAPAGTDQ